jgi:4-hydroxy-tetrahydrodipicolinate reductase
VAVRVCVLGSSGKMGRAVLDAAVKAGVTIGAAVEREEAAGGEVAGVRVGSDLAAAFAASDVYVDFTTPAATASAAALARASRRAAVIGTTGLDAAAERAIAALAEVAPVVVAANFSLGVNLLLGLVERAARALGPGWDAEIVELHHHLKRDAPSGTAIALGRAIAAGHGADYEDKKCYARAGEVGARPAGEIGVVAVRGGDVVGEHTAYFFGEHERIELSHRATDRAIFAIGAVRAATWVVGKPAGRYDMLDVLGMRGA